MENAVWWLTVKGSSNVKYLYKSVNWSTYEFITSLMYEIFSQMLFKEVRFNHHFSIAPDGTGWANVILQDRKKIEDSFFRFMKPFKNSYFAYEVTSAWNKWRNLDLTLTSQKID